MINTGAVKEYLLKFLNSVYCDTCANRDSEGSHCEDCYRKHMLWELSEQTAETMAKEISELKHELTAYSTNSRQVTKCSKPTKLNVYKI